MKNLSALLVLSLLSLGVANASSLVMPNVTSASLMPCALNQAPETAVISSTVITCGGLTFSNFEVTNPTGGAAGIIDILPGSDYDSVTGAAFLNFNPNLAGASEDEQLLYEVSGGLSQIDMSVGGYNAIVTERACANPISTTGDLAFLCTDPTGTFTEAPLGQLTVSSGTPDQPVYSSPFTDTNPIYIFEDIETGYGGEMTEFIVGFVPGPTVPEPVNMVLLGSGLLALGLLRRRSRSK